MCLAWDTTYEHKQIIKNQYIYLIETVEAKFGLLDCLRSASVLSQAEWESVNVEVVACVQNEKLLSVLSRKTNEQFDKFLDALDETGQTHVRDQLTGRKGNQKPCYKDSDITSICTRRAGRCDMLPPRKISDFRLSQKGKIYSTTCHAWNGPSGHFGLGVL